MLDILYLLLLIALPCSIVIFIRRRKKAGVTGFKSALTSICFYSIAGIYLIAYWFNYFGLFVWLLGFTLLLLAAYFTKYLPAANNES